MKILNLYAGIGGNRKLWGDGYEITAIENVPEIAKIYKNFFPKDQVIVTDAHKFLLNHFDQFDFIWSSPPCLTHSVTNNFLHAQGTIRFPDMKLYEEIIFLQHWFKGAWVVENVKSYYPPLISPQIIGRHYFWSNFNVSGYNGKFLSIGRFGPTKKGRTDEKDKLKRNCVEPQIGLHIFKCAFKDKQTLLNLQGEK